MRSLTTAIAICVTTFCPSVNPKTTFADEVKLNSKNYGSDTGSGPSGFFQALIIGDTTTEEPTNYPALAIALRAGGFPFSAYAFEVLQVAGLGLGSGR